jgi:hypothetical protein
MGVKKVVGSAQFFRDLAKALGVPDGWRSFTLHVAHDDVARVECEFLVDDRAGVLRQPDNIRHTHVSSGAE